MSLANASQPVVSLRDAEACRALWCAVLLEQWDLALHSRSEKDRIDAYNAKRWFELKYFYRVCALAGVNPDAILSQYRKRSGA